MKLHTIISGLIVFNLIIPSAISIAQGTDQDPPKSDEIIAWEKFIAPKGFVLSKYLYENQNCLSIWRKQLPEFVKKNPEVLDPDVIEVGAEITLQRCKSLPVVAKEEPKENKEETFDSEDGWNQTVFKAAEDPSEPVCKDVKLDDKNKEDDLPPPYVHVYAGFLTENEKYERVDSAYGVGVTGDLFDFLGYHIRGLGSAGAIFLNNEVLFKTKPGESRAHLIFGFGNRIGLANRDLDRLNKGVDSYTYAGFGFEKNRPLYRYQMSLTTNINSSSSLNFGVSAQKKFGKDYWFGMFGEYQSTRSIIDDGDDRRYISSGLKFSF